MLRYLLDVYGENNFAPYVRQPGDTRDNAALRRKARIKAWGAALQSSGKTDQQLAIGAARASHDVRVGKSLTAADIVHRAYFRPEDVGAPSVDQAYRLAVEQRPKPPTERDWPDPVAAAALQIKSWEWRHMDAASHRAAFERQYQAVVDALGHGADLSHLLPSPDSATDAAGEPSDETTARAGLEACRAALRGSTAAALFLFLLAVQQPQNVLVHSSERGSSMVGSAHASTAFPATRSVNSISKCLYEGTRNPEPESRVVAGSPRRRWVPSGTEGVPPVESSAFGAGAAARVGSQKWGVLLGRSARGVRGE